MKKADQQKQLPMRRNVPLSQSALLWPESASSWWPLPFVQGKSRTEPLYIIITIAPTTVSRVSRIFACPRLSKIVSFSCWRYDGIRIEIERRFDHTTIENKKSTQCIQEITHTQDTVVSRIHRHFVEHLFK